MRIARIGIGLSLVAACAGPKAGVGAGTDDADILTSAPDFGPAPGHDAAIGDLAGDHWDGTIDGDAFPSGSHRVQIVLDHASGDGARTGVIVFGMAAPPPMPNDPSVGYPRGFDFRNAFADGYTETEGFVYPIVDGLAAGTHLNVTANGLGLWERWCELQTPVVLDFGPDYGCLPPGRGSQSVDGCIYDPAASPAFAIDCGRLAICQTQAVCACTADGCVARMRDPIEFELDIAGDTATGTVTLMPGRSVRLTRM